MVVIYSSHRVPSIAQRGLIAEFWFETLLTPPPFRTCAVLLTARLVLGYPAGCHVLHEGCPCALAPLSCTNAQHFPQSSVRQVSQSIRLFFPLPGYTYLHLFIYIGRHSLRKEHKVGMTGGVSTPALQLLGEQCSPTPGTEHGRKTPRESASQIPAWQRGSGHLGAGHEARGEQAQAQHSRPWVQTLTATQSWGWVGSAWL